MQPLERENTAVYLGPFWQDDLEFEVVDNHVVVNVVDHPHVEDKVVLAVGEEVLPRGDVVAQDVVGLPAAEQGEPRPQLNLNRVVEDAKGRRRDVADVVPVVRSGSCK